MGRGRENRNSWLFDLETCDLKGRTGSRKENRKEFACLVLEERKERVLPRVRERKRKRPSFV